ncbi:A/G-specific adenine glycosylase [Limnobacter alexandrii]|jgi:A/G-specific adenine glycosylase|uniref:A/G-specific adenine glycosylase n=1 Tax=Limnobacter alexandrii TaxID=2570352 RepID=UPI001108F572|nr:A/G-specific adenine glycosylase [Limnobacter alexandrii]
MNPLTGETFAQVLVNWQKQHGRQTLPWQHTGDAYKVWLSEVMLQQTQVRTVLAYYARFLQAYPTVSDLAAAPEQDVMQLWAGLGYYTRARNLHACAKQVVARFGGQFPRTVAELESLPGIGQSTAGAIASLAYGVQAPILDGNVKRVFCRYYGIEGYPEQTAIKKSLWDIAEANVPKEQPGVYNQALMDLGATCCMPRNPACSACPVMHTCVALRKGTVGLWPTPKPKKARPELHFISLLLEDARGALLLEPQTEKGVWQGLWAMPFKACSSQADLADLSRIATAWIEQFGLQALSTEIEQQLAGLPDQPWLVHELTHRKMHFKVLLVKVPGVWPGCHAVGDKPVPKIVHKLLDQVRVLAQGSVPQQNTLDLG